MDLKIVIRLDRLEKTYELGKLKVHALRDVSLSVSRGEFVVIMGPSGSGKTTLLNIIGGLDKPTRGKVFVEGLDLTILSDKELTRIRRDKIGFIFQFYNLIPVLTALENVELPLLMAGKPREKALERARELLKMVGLAERDGHMPDELSGGEQQRVAIARALANNPSIMLADEPTGDLDSKTGMDVVEVLYDVAKKENTTVIVATHDPMIAEKADRILRMHDGRIFGENLRFSNC